MAIIRAFDGGACPFPQARSAGAFDFVISGALLLNDLTVVFDVALTGFIVRLFFALALSATCY